MITIATLKAAGLTAEQIVAVLETVETEQAGSDEARRIKNRDRMRASRASCAAHSTHNAHAVHTDSALSSLLTSSESPKPKEEREGKKERAKRDRGHVCPDDFRPSEGHFDAGLKQNLSRPRVEACCEAMKSWSKSNANRAVARKVDWKAALFGWISREVERMGKVNGNGHAPRPGSREDRAERTAVAMEKLRNFANGHDPDDPGAGGQAGEPSFGGLPFAKPA